MSSNDYKIKLFKSVADNAYKEGSFTLASGQKSDYYIDCKEITLNPFGIELVGNIMFETISDWSVDAVGGLELGSVPISTAISYISASQGMPLNNIIVRKAKKGHGAGKKIEGAISKDSKIAIVEDVVSTGGSSMEAVNAIRSVGARVIGVVAIVDRDMGAKELFAEANLIYEPIFTIDQFRSR
ncbi:MAG: orotate phosphoribosyltransferase [Nitrospinota bacterium]